MRGAFTTPPRGSGLPHTIAIDARKLRDFGIGTYVRNLIRHLAELDGENRYLLLTAPGDRERLADLPSNFRTVTVRSPVYSLRELVTLSWRLYRLRVDLYHSTHYVLPAVLPCPVVVTIHDIIHLLYPEFLPNRLAFYYAERMIRRAVNRSDRIIAVSENTRKDLMRYFRLSGEKIEVVYNGIDEAFLTPLPGDVVERWLRDLGVPRPYLLFVGNPKPHKNLDNVVKAYAKALELHDFPHPLVCVGDRGGVELKVRLRAQQLGIEDRILLLGHVAQEALPALYQGASVFLYPTLYEGFGLPVVEAMASGAPVITSNTSALKEIAAGYAHLVNPLDVDGIARAIVQCVSDEDHRASLRSLGLRRAREFRWQRAAEQTLAIYRRVLDGEAPAEDGG
ncbi:MAG: glycosyltransferase family 1 protein [Acidobacteria bacterium]|nr:MAG: glycosyltransferase family 1 protein [Acidobacteriota bacterium]